MITLVAEDIEVATEGPGTTLLKLHAENIEVKIDDIDASLGVVSYDQKLAADGMDRRAVNT